MEPNVVTVASSGTPREGRPLLFVHGAWHGAWCWENFQDWFAARGWTTHAIDLRGHGDSPNDRSLRFTRIKHYITDLETAVAGIEGSPILIGHSMGGLVVQRYLESHPAPGAVLLAPDPIGGVTRATLRTMRRHPLPFLKANLTLSLGPLVAERATTADLFLADDESAEQIDWLHDRVQSESYLAYLDMLFFVRPRPQLVSSPVSIIAGSVDRIFSVRELRKTARVYGTPLKVIEGAAHDLMLGSRWEQTAAQVAAAIEKF